MIKHPEQGEYEWEKYPFGLVISVKGLEQCCPFELSAVTKCSSMLPNTQTLVPHGYCAFEMWSMGLKNCILNFIYT